MLMQKKRVPKKHRHSFPYLVNKQKRIIIAGAKVNVILRLLFIGNVAFFGEEAIVVIFLTKKLLFCFGLFCFYQKKSRYLCVLG